MPVVDELRAFGGLVRDAGASIRAGRQNVAKHSPAPPPSGFVLDVGSGQAAHPRADLVVDKYVADDFERGSALDLQKPLVVADGEALPFDDDAFSYVIAAHVLEHAIHPTVFAAELSRIAGAGFVQVPSREAELTFGWPFHPWLIDRDGDLLIFNPRGDAAAPAGDLFHHAFHDSRLFQLWFSAHRERWHHTLHWVGDLPVEVRGSSTAPQTATLDVERTLHVLPRIGARGPHGAVRETLRCPLDRGRLRDEHGNLTCESCGRSYPQAAGVPILLAEAARS